MIWDGFTMKIQPLYHFLISKTCWITLQQIHLITIFLDQLTGTSNLQWIIIAPHEKPQSVHQWPVFSVKGLRMNFCSRSSWPACKSSVVSSDTHFIRMFFVHSNRMLPPVLTRNDTGKKIIRSVLPATKQQPAIDSCSSNLTHCRYQTKPNWSFKLTLTLKMC